MCVDMRIAIFGATGRTGAHVAVEALTRGHSVVGISRRTPEEAAARSRVKMPWHTADVLDARSVRAALDGADAVIVCLGPSREGDTTCGRGTRVIVEAMRELGIERIACQTGAMIGHLPSSLGWILRRIRSSWRSRDPAQARDRDAQERVLQRSGLRATIVRPTRLVDGTRTRALVSPDAFVPSIASSRYEDVAAALVDGVEGRFDAGRDRMRGVVVLSRPTLDAGFLARWTVANSLGEMLGLGAVGAAAVLARSLVHGSVPGALALGAGAGVFEGAIVAALLGAFLLAARPEVRLGSWLRWTIAGAVVCWGLGMLPSALVNAHAALAGPASPPSEPPRWFMTIGASGLGLVAGIVLGAMQSRALRPMGIRARTWIAATSIGWAAGMPLVFAAASDAWSSGAAIARGLLLLAGAGAVVGLATGAALIWWDRAQARGLTRPRRWTRTYAPQV